jgi:hypothetical protein
MQDGKAARVGSMRLKRRNGVRSAVQEAHRDGRRTDGRTERWMDRQAAHLQQDVCQQLVVGEGLARHSVPDLHADRGAALGLEHVAGQVLAEELGVATPVGVLGAEPAIGVRAAQVPARHTCLSGALW